MDNTSDYNQKISTNLDTIEPQHPPPPKKKDEIYAFQSTHRSIIRNCRIINNWTSLPRIVSRSYSWSCYSPP